MGSGDSNSHLHASLVKTLHTELLPSLWLYNFNKKNLFGDTNNELGFFFLSSKFLFVCLFVFFVEQI